MERLLLKAATTAADEGIFEAVISTATVDRDQDIVEPAAMVAALKKWADVGKLVPLAWAHGEDVVGHIEPVSARIAKKEVIASGWIDQSDDLGAKAWRLVKSGTLSFSFGYLIPKGGATERPEGGLHIKEIDVFEISVVPVGPANNDTRVLSFKSAEALREEAKKVDREVEQARVPDDVPEPAPEPDPEPAPKKKTPLDAVALRAAADRLESDLERERNDARIPEVAPVVEAEPAPVKAEPPPPPRDAETLRRESKRVELDLERERNDERIADLPALPVVEPEPAVDYAAELAEVKSQLAETKRLVAEATKAPPVDPAELREQAKRVEREVEEITIPDVPESPKAPAEPELDLAKELQEVKATIAEMAAGLEDLKKEKANVTDKGPEARSVDSLRQQAEAVALEVASDGLSLRKPPQTVAQKRPEPALSLAELKQRTRTEMLGVLSGGTIE